MRGNSHHGEPKRDVTASNVSFCYSYRYGIFTQKREIIMKMQVATDKAPGAPFLSQATVNIANVACIFTSEKEVFLHLLHLQTQIAEYI